MAVFLVLGSSRSTREEIRNMSDVDTHPIDKGAGGHNSQKPIRVAQVVGRMMGGGVEATVMNHPPY